MTQVNSCPETRSKDEIIADLQQQLHNERKLSQERYLALDKIASRNPLSGTPPAASLPVQTRPPAPRSCGQFAGSLHPRLGLVYGCVLAEWHEGEHKPGGTCFAHGKYVGLQCPQWPKCAEEVYEKGKEIPAAPVEQARPQPPDNEVLRYRWSAATAEGNTTLPFEAWLKETGLDAAAEPALGRTPLMEEALRFKTDAGVDEEGLKRFTEAMRNKLATKRAEGYCGWASDCSVEHLAKLLITHVPKGDPVDIANFCMMLWNRGGSETLRAVAVPEPAAQHAGDKNCRGDNCHFVPCNCLCHREPAAQQKSAIIQMLEAECDHAYKRSLDESNLVATSWEPVYNTTFDLLKKARKLRARQAEPAPTPSLREIIANLLAAYEEDAQSVGGQTEMWRLLAEASAQGTKEEHEATNS